MAVIILDKAITLSSYPTLASAPVAAGTKAVNVGRIRNGQASFSGLFFGSAVTLAVRAPRTAFPTAYISSEIIEAGDSGGPVYVGSGAGRTIVGGQLRRRRRQRRSSRASISRTRRSSSSSPRTAGAAEAAGSGGSSSGGSTTPPPPPPPPPATTCAGGTPEAEPNDTSNRANALSGNALRRALVGADVDWYCVERDERGVAYDVTLTSAATPRSSCGSGTAASWHQISNTSSTDIAATSSGAGDYVIAVRGSAQTYTLKLTK